MGFLKNFLASCLGALVAFVVLLVVGSIVFSMVINSDNKVVISDNSVLYLDLNSPIVELAIDDPLAELIPGEEPAIGLLQLKDAIAYAKTDAKIKGIYLRLNELQAGITSIKEIRESLLDFRESGKWVVAYSSGYSEGAYYLATAADQIYLNPEGQVELNGLSINVTFFKRLLDKLEIKPQVFRVGDFKSAVEPFVRENMSEENRLQLNQMVNGLYDGMLKDISAARQIPEADLAALAKTMVVRKPGDAIKYKLADGLMFEDQVRDDLRKRLGLEESDKIDFSRFTEYTHSMDFKSSPNEIAVIVADGEIMPGKADNGLVGSNTFVNELRRARNNDRVKAIVIRVNSPGGVFQAADDIWREVSLATEEKPVIASMSDYATSGGYYLAMASDTIVAQPTTVTGSIGIFSVLFDMSRLLENKLGITSEEVKTGDVGGLITVTRPLTAMEQEIWQQQTNDLYEAFTRKAAEGRNMSQEDIKKIASGRVWTGVQGKDNGLVDVLGGYQDAIEIAAEKAGIAADYKVRYYPQPKTFLEKLTSGWEDQVSAKAIEKEMGDSYYFYQGWKKLQRYQGVQARLPFELEIR
ncbi:MAG: signal peptide peptidase SppA [Cyclobacteriaceae bacterium]